MLADSSPSSSLQSGKYIAFVVISAALLYIGLRRFRRLTQPNSPIQVSSQTALAEQNKRLGLPLCAGVVVLVVTVLFNLVYTLQAERNERISTAETTTQNLAAAIDEYTASTIKGVDLALTAASRTMLQTPVANVTNERLVRDQLIADLRSLPSVKAIFVLDARGQMMLDTDTFQVKPIDFSDRDYFIAARDTPRTGLVIGKPIVSRTTGTEYLPITHQIRTSAGKFVGVMVAALETAQIQRFYDSIKVGENGVVMLFGRDGTLLIRSRLGEEISGENFSNSQLFRQLLPVAKTGTYRSASGIDRTLRISSFRELADYPIVITVELSEAELLAGWLVNARVSSFVSLIFVLAVGWLGWSLWWGLQQRDELTQKLIANETRFRNLTELSSDWYWEQDADFRYVMLSPNFEERTGISPIKVIGKTREDFSTDYREFQRSITAAQRAHKAFRDITYHRIWPDGSERWYQTSGAPVINAEGVFTGYRGTTNDVTALMQAQQAVVESEKRYRLMFDANPHPMWVYDAKSYAFLAVNQAACEQYGYTVDEFMNMNIFDLRPPSEVAILKADLEKSPKERETRDWVHRRKNGEEFIARVIGGGIDFFDLPARLVLALDITEQRKAEAEILKLNTELEQRVKGRTAELESMNRELESFSYSVAHDLRAPLRHINGYAGLLLASNKDVSGDTKRQLNVISRAAENMGHLIDGMLDLSRVSRTALELSAVDMNRLLGEVLAEAKREAGTRDILWTVDDLPKVMGDTRLLRQVFVNLVGNAVKFTAKRANAKIEIGIDQVHCNQLRDGEVVILVRDNGAGFDMAHSNKLFDAFQRLHTQAEFPGTGIGLATVSRIVQRHGGRVWAEGEPDAGATFYVLLKRA
jgi:PAS domain S-box-containing protein